MCSVHILYIRINYMYCWCCWVASVVSDSVWPHRWQQSTGSSVPAVLHARILEWLPFPPPGDLPNPGIESMSPSPSETQVDSIRPSHHESPLEILCPKYFTLVLQNCNFLSILYVPLRLASSVNTECLACCLSNSVNIAVTCLHIVSTLIYEENPDHLNQLLISDRIKWGSQYNMWHYCTCILLFIPS